MKTLILMRHAKSSWSNPSLEDFDRPLNPRGKAATTLMGQWLTQYQYLPEQVITSGAARCRETWQRTADAMQLDIPVSVQDNLYMAGPETLLKAVQAAPDSAETTILINHQPSISALALNVLNEDIPAAEILLISRYPSAAITVINADVSSWKELAFGIGQLVAYQTPKSLPQLQ